MARRGQVPDDRWHLRAQRRSRRPREATAIATPAPTCAGCGVSTRQSPPSCARPTAAGASSSTAFRRPTFELADTREYGDTEELVSYAGVNATAFGGKLQNRIGFAFTDTDRENIDPDSPVPTTFDATGRNERWEYQGTLTLNDAISGVFGLESERSELEHALADRVRSEPDAACAIDAQLDSVYAQVSVSPIDALTLTAGMRYDDHDTFGNESTGRAAARLVRDADDDRARELRRRLQGADAVPAVQRIRQRGSGAGARGCMGRRHRAAFARATRWCCRRPTSAATRAT